jgi:hypothetical protein
MGKLLYEGLFRLFSKSSHADMLAAFIVSSGETAPLVDANYAMAALAALSVLVAVVYLCQSLTLDA